MTTDSAVDARAHARAMIERALIPDNGRGGVSAAFDQLEKRLRQPYAQALTDEDRDDIRAYVNARVDALHELLNRTPERVWSQSNDDDALAELKDGLRK
jgi:hypothetical protein